jgi:thioredoxin reductase (NADPH)
MNDVIIIGSGPAGYTAAIYSSRANLKTYLIAGELSKVGGQLITTTDVENFPGFPNGVDGFELVENMKKQAEKYGTQMIIDIVTNIEKNNDNTFTVYTNNNTYITKSVIVSSGAYAKKLDFPGSETYFNKGISACVTCDGALPIFRKKESIIIGGGDTAMEEAMFLSKYASKVYIVHRRDKLRASKIMQDRVMNNPKIEIIWNSNVIEAKGDENRLMSVVIQNVIDNTVTEKEVRGLFFAIGHKPSSDFVKHLVDTDEDDYIITIPGTSHTSVKGIFACGDVQDKKYRQAITAAGSGCMAALDVCHYLDSIK